MSARQVSPCPLFRFGDTLHAMFKKSERVEVVEGRWKGHFGIVEQVIPIRADGREIGERYGVVLEESKASPIVPKLVTLLGAQLRKAQP